MVQLRKVKYSELDPLEIDVGSSRLKQTHGSVMQGQVE